MRIVCIGECMAELARTESGDYRRNFAGDTFNTAVYLSRTNPDAEVVYLSAVGDDAISTQMLADMQRQGLNTDYIQVRSDKTVGLYMIDTDDNGERSFTYWRQDAAARYLLEQKSPGELLQALDVDLIYLSGISLAILPEPDRDKLLAWLDQQSAPVAFDPNYRPRLWRDQTAAQLACSHAAKLSTYLLTTLDDDLALWDVSTMDEAMALWQSRSDAELVIKNGAEAIRLSYPEIVDVMPLKVESPLDTTGAGDAFNGVYLGARLMGTTPRDAARLASELCARVVMCRGAILPR